MSDQQNLQDFLRLLKAKYPQIAAKDLQQNLDKYSVIDVREDEETVSGQIPGAIHIPRGRLEMQIESRIPDRHTAIVLYCAGGTRSLLAADNLAQLGYKNLFSLELGIKGWKDCGLPLTETKKLNPQDSLRYSAQLRLPQIGESGQEKISRARVLIVGAGGLGSPTAYYLAAAGVGHLGIIDDDKVDFSNLQRQILHNTDRVGMSKTDSAAMTLRSLNPRIEIVTYTTRLDRHNVDSILPNFDIIVDGTDNFQTRYLINDACLKHEKINIHASVFCFEGQVTSFCHKAGPCYRCLYPEPPPPELAPNCAEAGVLGVLPGTMGLLQATETIKTILCLEDLLIGRLLKFDALKMQFQEFRINKQNSCSYCNKSQTIEYVDYERFCNKKVDDVKNEN